MKIWVTFAEAWLDDCMSVAWGWKGGFLDIDLKTWLGWYCRTHLQMLLFEPFAVLTQKYQF